MRSHLAAALLFALLVSPSARADPPEREPVDVRESRDAHGHAGVLFTLPRHSLDPRPSLTLKEARLLVAALEHVYGRRAPLPPVAFPGASGGKRVLVANAMEWTQRVRGDCLEFYGPGQVRLLSLDVLDSPFIQALRLSPRYMAEGVRGAAVELLNSPNFLASMGVSMVLYLAALAAPEPLVTKGAVAALTLYLMWTYGATEVLNVARAVVALYQEAQAARTRAELEEAARHFGESIGGVGLRVGVVVALAGLAGKVPEVPRTLGSGGLWTRLGTPEGVLMRSVAWEGVPVAQTTANGTAVMLGETAVAESSLTEGTFLLMGAVMDAEAGAATSTSKPARTTGGCRKDNSQGDAPEHHIATNKNHTAEVRGGPWTPRFEEFFQRVGMDLDHPANRLFVIGHKGPHPEDYHNAVYLRLRAVFSRCKTAQECKEQFIKELDGIAQELCTSGSELNKLITKKP